MVSAHLGIIKGFPDNHTPRSHTLTVAEFSTWLPGCPADQTRTANRMIPSLRRTMKFSEDGPTYEKLLKHNLTSCT